jgi:hypothetical protein
VYTHPRRHYIKAGDHEVIALGVDQTVSQEQLDRHSKETLIKMGQK